MKQELDTYVRADFPLLLQDETRTAYVRQRYIHIPPFVLLKLKS